MLKHAKYMTIATTMLSACLVAGITPAMSADVTLRMDPERTIGATPELFEPSVMLSWAGAETVSRFLGIPGEIGTVRITLEPQLSDATSLDDYRNRLEAFVPALKKLGEKGAAVVVTFARMPRFAALSQSDEQAGSYGFTRREASPPRDYRVLEDLAEITVRQLGKAGDVEIFYEFWNEPEAEGFWVGSQDDLFRSYAAFVAGARRADSSARVGGIAVAGWNSVREGQPKDGKPLIQAFLEYAGSPPASVNGGARLPLDFLSWHNFAATPEVGWGGAEEIIPWLEAAGYPADTPQFITEWNRWGTFPEWYDDARDTYVGAAYLANALHAMDRVGIDRQTIATLQDFNEGPPDDPFIGDFGLITARPFVEKASFQFIKMLATMGPERIGIDVPDDAALKGLNAFATRDGNRLYLIVSRFAGAPLDNIIRSLQQSGFRKFADIGISQETFVDVLRGNTDPSSAGVPARARPALEAARKAAEAAQSEPDAIQLSVDLTGNHRVAGHSIHLIDPNYGDPHAAYEAVIGSGASPGDALDRARGVAGFEPASQGGSDLPEVGMARQSVVLYTIELAN